MKHPTKFSQMHSYYIRIYPKYRPWGNSSNILEIIYFWSNMPIIRTTEGHGKVPSEDILFDSGGEGGQLSAWNRMMARAGYVPILLWPMIEWPALEMHSIVIAPGLAKSLSGELDLWDNLRLTYTLITTNIKNRVEQYLTICRQLRHGYHIYLTSIDWMNYLYWMLDLKRTYFNILTDI